MTAPSPSRCDPAQEILRRLFARTTQGIKMGLERMQAAAAALGDPQQTLRIVHVAGTNGKGSVCMFLESMLRAAGHHTGLYTSPHLIDFEERFCLDGQPVTTARWLEVYRQIEPVIERHNLTFFEATTLLAFELFRRNNVSWAVIETGLGGRLDATNIVLPRLCVIAALGLDHAAYLGDNLSSVAVEKLGIVKPGVPLVMAAPAEPEIRELAAQRCREQGADLHLVEESDIRACRQKGPELHFIWQEIACRLAATGAYQARNAACSLQALSLIAPDAMPCAATGLARVCLPGRFQIVTHQGRTLVFDVGHNPQAAARCAATLKEFAGSRPVCIIAGIMADKEYAPMLAGYAAVAHRLVLVCPQTPRAASPDQLRAAVPPAVHCVVESVGSVARAVTATLQGPTDQVTLICGSFHTVGEAMCALGIRPFEQSKAQP